jgi:tRNA(Ile)-lysidine synthase
LVPAFRAVHPAAEANILAVAEILRDEAEVLDALVDSALEEGGDTIALATLGELPVAVARLVVQRLADRAAGGPAPGAARRLEEIRALADRSLDLPHGVRAVAEKGRLHFERTPALPKRMPIN